MTDCLFCKIVAGDIPSHKVYEDDDVLAFHDIDKKAPVHVLIIPKMHIASVAAIEEDDLPLVAKVIGTAKKLAFELGINEGFRLVANTGADGGQTVDHLHFHLMGGRAFTWPPG